MKLVCDDTGVWKVFAHIVFEGVTEIDDSVFYSLSSFDVLKARAEVFLRFAFDDLEHAPVGVVDENGCELGSAVFSVFSERMLVDSDGFRPRVLTHSEFLFEARVEGFEYVTSGDSISALDTPEIDEVLAGPEDITSESLGGSKAFSDPRDVLCEGFLAGFAPEAAFFDLKIDHLTSDGRILEDDRAMVVDALARGGALRADFHGGAALSEVTDPGSPGSFEGDKFQFREKDEVG
jgi:hypothetical protein